MIERQAQGVLPSQAVGSKRALRPVHLSREVTKSAPGPQHYYLRPAQSPKRISQRPKLLDPAIFASSKLLPGSSHSPCPFFSNKKFTRLVGNCRAMSLLEDQHSGFFVPAQTPVSPPHHLPPRQASSQVAGPSQDTLRAELTTPRPPRQYLLGHQAMRQRQWVKTTMPSMFALLPT